MLDFFLITIFKRSANNTKDTTSKTSADSSYISYTDSDLNLTFSHLKNKSVEKELPPSSPGFTIGREPMNGSSYSFRADIGLTVYSEGRNFSLAETYFYSFDVTTENLTVAGQPAIAYVPSAGTTLVLFSKDGKDYEIDIADYNSEEAKVFLRTLKFTK